MAGGVGKKKKKKQHPRTAEQIQNMLYMPNWNSSGEDRKKKKYLN